MDTAAQPDDGSGVCLDPLWSPLPQPTASSFPPGDERGAPYTYLPYEEVEKTFFPGDAYPRGTLCWVLKSKGRQQKSKSWASAKRRKKQKKGGGGAGGGLSDKDEDERAEDGGVAVEDDGGAPGGNGPSSSADEDEDDERQGGGRARGEGSVRSELFLRARVISDDGGGGPPSCPDHDWRVLIRYPRGSTYRVRRSNLVPVLEPGIGIGGVGGSGGGGGVVGGRGGRTRVVLVVSETHDYRRTCVVHTCVGETFLEIGCDFGLTVDRVRRALTEVEGVPREDENDDGSGKGGSEQGGHEPNGWSGEGAMSTCPPPRASDGDRHVCLGIDKAPESIDVARDQYPGGAFSVEDALTGEGAARLRDLCRQTLAGGGRGPSVVAVDINGNRELPAVLRCLDNIMQPGEDARVGHDWDLPRLIVVKSRELYVEVRRRQRLGLQL